MAMKASDWLREYEERQKTQPKGVVQATCKYEPCQKPIYEEDFRRGEVTEVPDGHMHSDCYYEGLGKLIEEHPICAPGPH